MSAPDSGAAVDMPELTARQRRSVLRWQGTDRFYKAFLVAETGDPDLRYQGELLFHDPVVRYERVRTDGEIPVVDAEVVM